MNTREILEKLSNNEITVEEADLFLKKAPYAEMDFATLDTHRKLRCGACEVIYGAGKTADQITKIVLKLMENGEETILVTRVDEGKAQVVSEALKSANTNYLYDEISRILIAGEIKAPDGIGKVAIITGGTSDLPVAKEAYYTLRALGNEVIEINDVGVAGLHRLLHRLDDIMSARVVIAIAGMEGALASVVGGLVSVPVIAVPTSVGYGASFEGLSALLSMLNSCASGVSVVNIDNGFGAAYQASQINHLK